MIRVPRALTLLIDSREKYPLLVPDNLVWYEDRGIGDGRPIRIKTKVSKLDYGDYLLEGYEDRAVVERKGSLDELHQNLYTVDRTRFVAALGRLTTNCSSPYLLLDLSPTNLWTATERTPNPAAVWDALLDVVGQYRLKLLWGCNAKQPGPRRVLGEQVLRLLIAHALRGDQWEHNRNTQSSVASTVDSGLVAGSGSTPVQDAGVGSAPSVTR